MKRIFTKDDIQSLIATEKKLKFFFRESNFEAEKSEYEPSKQTLQNIFSYAQALSVRKTDSLGNIEMILN